MWRVHKVLVNVSFRVFRRFVFCVQAETQGETLARRDLLWSFSLI